MRNGCSTTRASTSRSPRSDKAEASTNLGIQAEDEAELAELKTRGQAADRTLFDEGQTVCCYARSEKHWVTDPQGIAWEHFQTMDGAVPVYGQSRSTAKAESACCDTGACC